MARGYIKVVTTIITIEVTVPSNLTTPKTQLQKELKPQTMKAEKPTTQTHLS